MNLFPRDWLSRNELEEQYADELEKFFFPDGLEKPTEETETLVGATSTAGPSTASSADIQGENKESVSNVFSTPKYSQNAVHTGRVEPQQFTHSSFDQIQISGAFDSGSVHSMGFSSANQVYSDRASTSASSRFPTFHESPVASGQPSTVHFFEGNGQNFPILEKTLARVPLQSCEPALLSIPQMVPKYPLKGSVANAGKADHDYTPAVSSNLPLPLPRPKRFECSICHQKFGHQVSVRLHRHWIHPEERPYQCDICDEKFAEKRQLFAHYDIHSGMALFNCDSCFRKFSSSLSLQRHHRFHTDEKPFECTVCGRVFSMKYSLNRHQKCHRLVRV